MIKTFEDTILYSSTMVNMKNNGNLNANEDMEQQETVTHSWQKFKMVPSFQETVWKFLFVLSTFLY